MSNYNQIQDRTNSIISMPRLLFQLPNQPTSPTTNQPQILFCQTGCQLEFNFSNIPYCHLYNNNSLFSITPPPNDTSNYVNWNGSNINGQNMSRFNLKEVFFTAPVKDIINDISYEQSIQMFFTYVDPKNSNLMICISVLGQVNNQGRTAQTNGFTLLNTLAPLIPLKGDDTQISGLSNFNLGTLLPNQKSFFTTLINNNNTQYIIMSRVIDIPSIFFNNMIQKVIGGQDAFNSRVADYKAVPINPANTIIFFSENIPAISPTSGQSLICNANCDRVPGQTSALTPKISSTQTTKSIPTEARTSAYYTSIKPSLTAEEEYCAVEDGEEVGPGPQPGPGPKPGPGPQPGPVVPSGQPQGALQVFLILFFIFALIGLLMLLSFLLYRWSGGMRGTFWRGFFSTKFFNRSNVLYITLYVIGLVNLLITFLVAIIGLNKDANWWISLVVGMIIYIIILIVGFRKRKPYINQLLSSIAASSMATPFLNALLRSTNQIANSIGGSRNFANSVVQAVQAQSNANAAATVVQQQVQQTGNNAGVALANNLVNLTGQSLGRVQGAAINNNPGLVMPGGGGVDVGTQLSGVDMGVGIGGNVGVMLDVLRAADRVNGVVARQQPSGDLQQIAGSVVNVINSLQGMSGVDSQVAAVEGDGLAPVAAGLGVDVGTQVQGLVESGVQTVPIGPPLGQLVGNRWRGLLDKIRGIGIGKPVDVVNYLQGMLPQKQFTDDELKKVDMLVKKLQNVSDGIRKGLIDISKSNGDPDVQTLARLVDRSVPFNEGTNGEYIDPTKSRLTPKGVALLYKYASKGLKGPGQVS